jgi:NADP-dependent 3-hydroxy acid dehydrogenase YdfG
MMDLGIKDHVAIVTGGGAGIGAQTCRTLAGEGVNVAVADLNLENAEKIAEEARATGVKAIALEVDVSQQDQTETMVSKTLSEFGKIDILNNVAGVALPGFFQNSTKEQWETEINICLYGVMNCCKSIFDTMSKQNSGKIVNVASDAGKAGESLLFCSKSRHHGFHPVPGQGDGEVLGKCQRGLPWYHQEHRHDSAHGRGDGEKMG